MQKFRFSRNREFCNFGEIFFPPKLRLIIPQSAGKCIPNTILQKFSQFSQNLEFSVLLAFATLHDVAAHLRELATSLGIPLDAFEVVTVTVTNLTMTSICTLVT